MDDNIKLVKAVVPDFCSEYLDQPFDKAGIESFDLVILRVSFEKKYGEGVPTSIWLNFTCISQIIDYYNGI